MVNSSLQGEIKDIQEYLVISKTMFEHRLNNFDMEESKFKDFILHKTIGLGAYGRVWLVNHKSDDNKFLAMKVSLFLKLSTYDLILFESYTYK